METVCDIPADFRFKELKHVRHANPDDVNTTIVGRPKLSSTGKLMTRTLWLSNNNIKSVYYLDIFFGRSIDKPLNLVQVDLSYNYLSKLDSSLLLFKNLKIFYLHCNRICDPSEVLILNELPCLHFLTLHGNPVYDNKKVKNYLVEKMPQIVHLEYIREKTDDVIKNTNA